MLLMGLFALSFTACSDNDSKGGGVPEITGVKILTSDTINYSYDNFYTKAGQGSLLAIMGNNLGGALKVYVNGQELTFNSTMNTEHSLIVSIPTEEKGFKLSAFNDVPDEIRVVTPGGEATYAFKITAPGPQLNRVQARYPRNLGDEINLFGKNLVDIESAYFTDLTAEHLDTTEWETVGGNHVAITDLQTVVKDHYLNTNSNAYETTSQLKFNMPSVPYDEGCIVLECASGTVYIPYYRVPGKPVLTSVNTDMPIPGTDLIITGREFVQVEAVTYGDVTLTPDEFTVAETEDQITIHFTKKPSEGSGTTLSVTTPGGVASIGCFYDYSTLLLNFDRDEGDLGWNPKGELMPQATEAAIPYCSDGNFYRINAVDGGNNWWGTMCYFSRNIDWSTGSAVYGKFVLPSYDVIPADASTDDVYLVMEVWNNDTDFGATQSPIIHYVLQSAKGDREFANWADGAYVEKPLHDTNNAQPKKQWYRAVVPFSRFNGWFGKTYADIVAEEFDRIRIMHQNRTSASSAVDIMFDNVRVLYLPAN